MVGQDRIKKLMDIFQHIIIHNTMCFALERRKCEQFLGCIIFMVPIYKNFDSDPMILHQCI